MALKEEFEFLAFKCCYCFHFNAARKQRPLAPPPPSLSNANSTTSLNEVSRCEFRGIRETLLGFSELSEKKLHAVCADPASRGKRFDCVAIFPANSPVPSGPSAKDSDQETDIETQKPAETSFVPGSPKGVRPSPEGDENSPEEPPEQQQQQQQQLPPVRICLLCSP